jgi:hypothetical protein
MFVHEAHACRGQRNRTFLGLKLLYASTVVLVSPTTDINDVVVLGREVELETQPLAHYCKYPEGEQVL